MTSFGIRCPRFVSNASCPLRSNQTCRCTPCSSFLKFNGVNRNLTQRVSSSAALSDYPVVLPFNNVIAGNGNEPKISEKLDDWMRDSVVEIVKNLKQAPLLVQIYADNNDGSTKVETGMAVAENWANVNKEWSDGDKPSPDGIILVEELIDENDSEAEKTKEEETRAWGVVIQGKGVEKEKGPACYLLKTSRVGSGMGSFCTHFSLIKVKSFRKSTRSQFIDCWLLD